MAGVFTAVQTGTKPQVVTTLPGVGGPSAAVVSAPALATPPAAAVAPVTAQATPVAEKQIALKINGHTYRMIVQARATLADVIRYQVGLTGTKIGCNREPGARLSHPHSVADPASFRLHGRSTRPF